MTYKFCANALLFILCVSFLSCDKCGLLMPSNAMSADLEITYIDKTTKQFLIKEPPSAYLPADVKVYNENLEPVEFRVYDKYNSISIPVMRAKNVRHTPEVNYEYRIFIDLKTDRDTIDYSFMIKEEKCGTLLDYIKVKYNNHLVVDLRNDINANFKIEK